MKAKIAGVRQWIGGKVAACNSMISEGKLRVLGFAPYERYYAADGDFLGYGYDLEPRREEPGPAAGGPHVGHSGRASPRARTPGRSGPERPPGTP